MKAAAAIASLDRQLAENGQTVIIRKANAANPKTTVNGFVRGLTAKDIAGTTLTQSDKKVTISPTGLEPVGLPAEGWQLLIADVPHAVIVKPEIIRLADVVVRVNLMVRGG